MKELCVVETVFLVLEMKSWISCWAVRCGIAVLLLSLDFFGGGSDALDCGELTGF